MKLMGRCSTYAAECVIASPLQAGGTMFQHDSGAGRFQRDSRLSGRALKRGSNATLERRADSLCPRRSVRAGSPSSSSVRWLALTKVSYIGTAIKQRNYGGYGAAQESILADRCTYAHLHCSCRLRHRHRVQDRL
jgi:hypothetical protein